MNRKEFYEAYRQVRFIFSATSLYDIRLKVEAPEYTLQYRILDNMHKSISYAIMNRRKNTIYPISENKWAIGHNHEHF